MSDLHRNAAYNIVPNPRQPTCPAAADPPGWKGGSPEGGEGGLLRVRRPRSLVPPQGAIKSTGAMRYSSLKKPEETPKAKRRFLIKKPKEISQLQVKQAENAGGQSGQVPIISRPQVNQAQRQWQKSRVLFHHHQPDLFLGGAAAVHDAGDLAAAEHQNAVAQLDENVQVLAHVDDGDALFLLLV